MKQITEDYVSYEIAKLLKEKGFPQDYDEYHGLVYNEEDYECEYEIQRMVLETRQVKAGTLHSYPLGVPEPKCYCPTHQMALKWLREVHRIETHIVLSKLNVDNSRKYMFDIYSSDTNRDFDSIQRYDFDSFDEAVEAALLYVLKNLI